MQQQNTFHEGLNMDISDYLLRNSMSRNCMNMRLLDLDGTSYAITTIRGTEGRFQLTQNYIPIASREYNDILYIFSGRLDITGQYFENFELGSYYSPDYNNPGQYLEQYKPFQNLDDSDFNVTNAIWDIKPWSFVDMTIQPEYDQSVNIIITAKNNPPRIINSGFDKDWNITERRGGANTNEYTYASVDTETRLVLRSQKIMNVAFSAIENGGKLTAGNYVYIFRYQTADFNETDVVNQSLICSVFEGYDENKNAASVNIETTKRVRLTLSNIDTDFAYVKVYFQYSTGENSLDQRFYEIIQPITINNKTSFDFIHDGYEETQEISAEAINLDFTAFDSVTSNTQAQGYLLLGGIKKDAVEYEQIAEAIQNVIVTTQLNSFEVNSPYNNPSNIYNYLSAFSGETYPYGIVIIMKDGSLSPVFPIQGYDRVNWSNLNTAQQNNIKIKGLYRFETIENIPFHSASLKSIAKGLKLNLSSIPQSIKDNSIGLFVVRGKRKPDLISQGILIPTLQVPSFDFTRDPQINNINDDGNYYDEFSNLTTDYKSFPILDSLVEPFVQYNQEGGSNDNFVILTDGTNRIDNGYMPCVVNNFSIGAISGIVPVKNINRWAFISTDYILNEARYITALQRPNMGFRQWSQVKLKAVQEGLLRNKWKEDSSFNVDTSLLYKFDGFNPNFSSVDSGEITDMIYVPSSSFATGRKFISALSVRFRQDGNHHFQARSFVDSYFGIEVDNLQSAALDPNSPYNQPVITQNYDQCEGPMHDNIGSSRTLAYLVSIYPRTSGLPIDDINQLYDSIDGISYSQISDRMTWDAAGSEIIVYGGDCYIGEIHKKLNRSGYTNPKEPSDVPTTPDNINQGIVFSFLHESEYNPALRLPYLNDVADSEKRTFYPYRNTDINDFRNYRLPETNKTNYGFGESETPKEFLTLPSSTPFTASNFFTRIVHSEKHVPNAFQNGYRSFIGVNYEDYDPDMGEIVRLFTHRDQIFVVFEHGIGIGPINQRIQTGSDSAGAIFVEPSGVLPPNLGFASRKIGAQDGNALIQTPSAIYGVDASRRKIWQFREGLLMISDIGFQSYLDKLNPAALVNPRLGYDPNYHEVIFTLGADDYDWTLCFKEGLERFTSFYSYKGQQYANISKDFYSFNPLTKEFDQHNIYGNINQSFVEFSFNPNPNVAKVVDFLNIISNEIPPVKVDLYTYDVDTYKEEILDENKMFQHVEILNEENIFTQERNIKLRDRKFVVQVPHIKYINNTEWGNGRLRNKYVIVRLTYETDQKVELLSVITNFRFSAS
jgi:hypothetical protein